MDGDFEKYSEAIALLRKEIKARDHDLVLAANFGTQLLEEREQSLFREKEIQSELEVLLQKNHSLQLDLETQKQTVKTQTSELEFQIEKVDSLQKKVETFEKTSVVQKQKSDNLFREKNDLENVQEDLKLENSSLKNKIKLLEQQIETLQENASQAMNESKNEDIHPDITSYITKTKMLENSLADLQYELESCKLRENRLFNTVKELEEEVADRDNELSSYSVEIQRAKDFSADLQCEIETLKLEQVDVNRRGNSMFGELDDRRRLVEEEYKTLLQKYKAAVLDSDTNFMQLQHLKGHVLLLRRMTSREYQDAYIEQLEGMLSSARRDIHTLSTKLENAIKYQQKQNIELVPSKSDKYDYLRVMNQQAHKKIKQLETDLMTSRLQVMNAENSLSETRRKLYRSQKEFHDLQIKNAEMQQEIDDFSLKSKLAPPPKPKPNIEILPGFESDPKCQKLFEILSKEQNTETKENDIIPGELMLGENGFVEIKPPTLSNRAILRKCFQKEDAQPRESSEIPLKEINNQSDSIPLIPIECEINPSATQNKKKNNNCTQQ